MIIRLMTVIDSARNSEPVSTRRFITTTSLLPRATRKAAIINSPKVTVLMPPAVEPEEPPMNIRSIDAALLIPVIAPRSMVLKPAVRKVTDWKKPHSSFSGTGIGPSVSGLFHSAAAITAVPSTTSRPVISSTSREYTSSRFFSQMRRRIFCQTTKPRPPQMISSAMMMLTYASPENAVSECYGPLKLPIVSKPALQKALTE